MHDHNNNHDNFPCWRSKVWIFCIHWTRSKFNQASFKFRSEIIALTRRDLLEWRKGPQNTDPIHRAGFCHRGLMCLCDHGGCAQIARIGRQNPTQSIPPDPHRWPPSGDHKISRDVRHIMWDRDSYGSLRGVHIINKSSPNDPDDHHIITTSSPDNYHAIIRSSQEFTEHRPPNFTQIQIMTLNN